MVGITVVGHGIDRLQQYHFTYMTLHLNEIPPSLKSVLPATDSRKRPDMHKLEHGQLGKKIRKEGREWCIPLQKLHVIARNISKKPREQEGKREEREPNQSESVNRERWIYMNSDGSHKARMDGHSTLLIGIENSMIVRISSRVRVEQSLKLPERRDLRYLPTPLFHLYCTEWCRVEWPTW